MEKELLFSQAEETLDFVEKNWKDVQNLLRIELRICGYEQLRNAIGKKGKGAITLQELLNSNANPILNQHLDVLSNTSAGDNRQPSKDISDKLMDVLYNNSPAISGKEMLEKIKWLLSK